MENWSLVPQSLYDARQRAKVLPQGGGQGVEGWRQSDDLGPAVRSSERRWYTNVAICIG